MSSGIIVSPLLFDVYAIGYDPAIVMFQSHYLVRPKSGLLAFYLVRPI